ncbi:hypothetical protein Tco_0879719 [Tanacetum coccineum]
MLLVSYRAWSGGYGCSVNNYRLSPFRVFYRRPLPLEEISNASPTSYSDLSLPDYEAFFRDSEPDSGDFTMDVVEDCPDCDDYVSLAGGFVLDHSELSNLALASFWNPISKSYRLRLSLA